MGSLGVQRGEGRGGDKEAQSCANFASPPKSPPSRPVPKDTEPPREGGIRRGGMNHGYSTYNEMKERVNYCRRD